MCWGSVLWEGLGSTRGGLQAAPFVDCPHTCYFSLCARGPHTGPGGQVPRFGCLRSVQCSGSSHIGGVQALAQVPTAENHCAGMPAVLHCQQARVCPAGRVPMPAAAPGVGQRDSHQKLENYLRAKFHLLYTKPLWSTHLVFLDFICEQYFLKATVTVVSCVSPVEALRGPVYTWRPW